MSNVNIQAPPAGIPPVILRCAVTENYFVTGGATGSSSRSAASFESNASECPYCRQMHRWGNDAIALDN